MSKFIEIQDVDGKMVTVEVSQEVYDLFEEERKQKESQRNEQRRHRTYFSFEEILDTVQDGVDLEKQVIVCEKLEKSWDIISKCTETQRRRFCLNRIEGFSLTKIAQMESCSLSAVQQSVDSVEEKIKKFFK